MFAKMLKRFKWLLYKNTYIARFGFEEFLRKMGVNIGENAHIYSDITTTESYFITIGDNVTISNDVQLITHDNSVCKFMNNASDVFGEIKIGNNCFIGARSIILYGVTIPDNTIVAAGSVVTKSITEEGKILGGNPAKIIGNTADFAEKMKPYAVNLEGHSKEERRQLTMSAKKFVR